MPPFGHNENNLPGRPENTSAIVLPMALYGEDDAEVVTPAQLNLFHHGAYIVLEAEMLSGSAQVIVEMCLPTGGYVPLGASRKIEDAGVYAFLVKLGAEDWNGGKAIPMPLPLDWRVRIAHTGGGGRYALSILKVV